MEAPFRCCPSRLRRARTARNGAHMNVQEYKRRLLELEARLSTRVTRERQYAREQAIDSAAATGGVSVVAETVSEDFTEAEADSAVLQQVRAALRRTHPG